MKPSFALDFRDGAIALLHRTSRGWQQVGTTAIDAPDLTEALGYLRSTALGLSPRGLATKLVLPNDQVLYTSVHAPGPDAAKRRKQIKAALEGLTPYSVEDLVFDWHGTGPDVMVAVVAKETLAEAEAFASEHRFNPVSVVAAPEDGRFGTEPFFGPTSMATQLLAEGEKVERDQEPILVLARELPRSETEARKPPVVEPVAPSAPAEVTAPVAAEAEAPSVAAVGAKADDHVSVQIDTVAEAAPVQAAVEATNSAPPPDVPAGSEARAPAPARTVEPAAAAPAIPPADEPPLPDFSTARVPPEGAAGFDPKALAVDLVDEAPMALDVADDPREPAAEGQGANTTDPDTPAAEKPAAEGPAPSILAAFTSRRPAETMTPRPSEAAIPSDFAKAAAEAKARKAPTVGPAPTQRPSVPRPTLAKPVAAAPAGAAKDTLPFPGRSTGSTGRTAAPPAAKGKPVAPLAAASKTDRNVVPLAKPKTDKADTADKSGIGQSPGLFGGNMKVGGKPRYLGLILTGLLLLALVAVAAWSRLSLSSNEVDPNLSPTESAPIQTADLPSAEDEALADGQDIGTETDVAADVTNDATEPAVDQSLAVAGSEPSAGPSVLGDAVAAAKPGGDPQDEIFLASLDQAPQTLDAMLLPAPVGSNDPPPQLAAPPPPFGTVYTFDATGRIQPTPEGIITPEGVMLVAGAPKKLPPARPAALTQAAAPADNATTADQEAATVTAEVKTVQTFEADPSLAGKKPRLRPEGLVASQPEAEDSPTESLAPEARFADIRPARRPDSLTTPPPADPASAASLAAAGLADGSSLAIPISRKPAARPSGMDQAVDAAVAAALQSTDDVASTDQGESQAPEAQAEPEVEAPAPDIPTNASVAKQATDKNALNLNKIALIGIFGTASSRYAMVRLGGGGIKRVKVGDTLDGGRVAAITATELQYQKGGRMLTLTLPRG